jgi:hypothetical protein
MSEIPLYDDADDAPLPRARADVRFTSVAVRPYSDGRRMKLSFGLTPFQERPNIDMLVTNPDGQEVASLSLIEAMDTSFDFTVHLRGPEPRGPHSLRLTLFYRAGDDPDAAVQIVDERTHLFAPQPEPGA